MELGAYKIKQFSGDAADWPEWKMKFLSICRKEKCINAVKPRAAARSTVVGEVGDTDRATWDAASENVYTILSLSVTGIAAKIVLKYDAKPDGSRTADGVGAYRELQAKYELSGPDQINAMQERFHSVTIADGDDPDILFSELDQVVLCLAALGVDVAESAIKAAVMRALPAVYQPLRVVLRTTPDISYVNMQERIRVYYRQEVPAVKKKNQALFTEFSGKCHICGQWGHRKADCPNKRSGGKPGGDKSNGKKKFNGNCNRCHKYGHKKQDCKVKLQEGANAVNPPTMVPLTFIVTKSSLKEQRAVLDSGSSVHVTPSVDGVRNFRPEEGEIMAFNQQMVKTVGTGDLYATVNDKHGREVPIVLRNVLVAPGAACTLISVRNIMQAGGKVIFGDGEVVISAGGTEVPAPEHGGLFTLMLKPTNPEAYMASGGDEGAVAELWHARLGHRNYVDLKRLGEMNVGVPKGLSAPSKCEVCQVAKHTHTSFRKEAVRSPKEPFEMVHADLVGPLEVQSFGGHSYALGLTDERTRYRVLKFMRDKSEVPQRFEEFVGEVASLTRGSAIKVLGLHSDGGGEFISGLLEKVCQSRGIKQRWSAPHTPQQNGVAERSWRTILDAARAMVIGADLPKATWAEAMNTAVYILNRVPSAALEGDTPFHRLFGRHANLEHLRVFGCRAYAQVYDQYRKKLDPKAWRGIMVGYDPQNPAAYRIFNPEKRTTSVTAHVTFDEAQFPGLGKSSEPSNKGLDVVMDDDKEVDDNKQVGESKVGEEDKNQVGDQPRRTGWNLADDLQNFVQQQGSGTTRSGGSFRETNLVFAPGKDAAAAAMCFLSRGYDVEYAYSIGVPGDEPGTYEEAMRSAEAEEWRRAAQEEYDAIVKNETWVLKVAPSGVKPIPTRWVFKKKYDETGAVVRYKGRVVVQDCGYNMYAWDGNTFSPVAKISSIRALLALAAIMDWEIGSMDVKNAYLQSPVDGDIYVRMPPGYQQKNKAGEELVGKLVKSLYGLRQAARNWYVTIRGWFIKYGFKPSAADPCVFIKRDAAGNTLVVVLYVDDMMIVGNNKRIVDVFIAAIEKQFDVKDLGDLKWILGMEVVRDRQRRTLSINQKVYIQKMLERFGMMDCNYVYTPADKVVSRLPAEEQSIDSREFQSMVGSLIYAVVVSRPDIAFIVQNLGRNLQRTGEEHITACKRVFRYLKATMDLGITYGKDVSLGHAVVGYCDADYGGDEDTRRSTTAYLFMLGGGAITWASKLQPTVALSSAEAEYMAVSAAVQDAIYLRKLFNDLGFEQREATVIHEDNQGCIALTENPVMHKRTKHIDIRHHFIRERVESGEIVLKYVATQDQLADMLTKPLKRPELERLRSVVMGQKQL